ncbi:ComEC/Rec2 family competence protein [Roseibium sp.]|uniref:ComEC/Rec2 family competence protein n=1 Tax=Roseibium sp. TaxID=1936156 RepID=UPI003D152FB9
MGQEREGQFSDRRGLLCSTFAFSAGIAVYVILPEEPFWPFLAALLVPFCGAGLWFRGKQTLVSLLILAIAFAAGLTVATMRTAYVAAPRLAEAMSATVTGRVLDRRVGVSGARVLLEVSAVNGQSLQKTDFPERVRLRIANGDRLRVGEKIAVTARLFPPAGPVNPGGYDFSFRAYFSRIGATGYSYGPAEVIDRGGNGLRLHLAERLQRLRDSVASRIRSVLGSRPETGLAVALLVGDRSGIGSEQEEVLRAAGLAHILAISGLHMALFAGGAYAATLFLFALVPALSLRWPTHKWAAVTALIAASGYLLLSGAEVATQRSYLMIALVFLGVLTGRRGVTLRSVALAALFLLLIAPERLFFPGFQMSFAAVICLVAVYEIWRQRRPDWGRRDRSGAGIARRLAATVGKWGLGLCVTAIVAGLATGIVGMHHFGRVAPYGVVGNLLGMPVFSLVVMPMGVLALVLMPLGLSALPLTIMSFGLSLLETVARLTADLGDGAGAVGTLDSIPALLFMSALFAGLLLCGRQRLWALLPLGPAIVLVTLAKPPDIQIAASGRLVAARDVEGVLRVSSSRRTFAGDLWLQAEGVPGSAILSRKMKSPQRACDQWGCVVLAHDVNGDERLARPVEKALAIALPKEPEALVQDCAYADIIVSDLIAPRSCAASALFDKGVRERRGAVSIWLERESDADFANPQSPENAVAGRGSNSLRIGRIKYAIPDPPRPWHRQGTVTRASLRKALAAQSTASRN